MKTTPPLTLLQIRRRYTRVVRVDEDLWKTYLQIDHQGFCVVEETTKERALWYARQLALALHRMLKEHCG